MTEAERRLWSRLRRNQLRDHYFRRQIPLGPYIADFACMEEGLVGELDGGQHAIEPAHDIKRDAWFAKRGYRVIRFWNNDVLRNTDAVVSQILRHLEEGR